MRSTIMTAISVVPFDLLQHKVREISLSKQIYSHIISGSSRKWSDSTWTHRKQLEQLLQQVTTLSVSHSVTHFPLISPGVMSWRSLVFCCLPCSRIATRSVWVPFHGTLSRHGITRASSVLRRHRALLLVVKVVFVVFPNSAGLFWNSANPISRFSGRTLLF